MTVCNVIKIGSYFIQAKVSDSKNKAFLDHLLSLGQFTFDEISDEVSVFLTAVRRDKKNTYFEIR